MFLSLIFPDLHFLVRIPGAEQNFFNYIEYICSVRTFTRKEIAFDRHINCLMEARKPNNFAVSMVIHP